MTDNMPKIKENKQNKTNLLIAAVTGQVGCVTLIIVLAAIFGGMALDAHLGTKPWFTVSLLIVSVPISLGLMIIIVKKAVSKIKTNQSVESKNEEVGIGKDS